MDVMKPIILLGAGRSGSTAIHRLFASHPHVGWLSRVCDRHPDQPSMNARLLQQLDGPGVDAEAGRLAIPGECYGFWEHHCKGFRHPCRDLLAGDVTAKTKAALPGVLSQLLPPNRRRLLIKITGWPRIGFLREIFADAKFVHIVRDGRAVANSLLNVDYWLGWLGPANWHWGELTPALHQEWERHGRSFVALAGIQWKLLLDAVERAKASLPAEQFYEIRYEDVCADPIGRLRDLVEFCELPWLPDFAQTVGASRLESRNYKWRHELTAAQQRMLEAVVAAHLTRYGYPLRGKADMPR